MSPIQHIDGATPRPVVPGSTGAEPGAAGSSNQFATVMRSAFSAAHTPQSSPNRSTQSSAAASVASPRQSARSQSSAAADSNSGGDNVSPEAGSDATQGGQVANGNPSAQAANAADQNASPSSDSSTQVSVQGGDGSTLTQPQIVLPVQADAHAVRSSSTVTSNGDPGTTQSATSSTPPGRKAALSGKGASSGGTTGASVSPAVVANVAVVAVTNTPAAKTLGSNLAGTETPADTTGATVSSKNSFAPGVTTSSALPVGTPQQDGTGGNDTNIEARGAQNKQAQGALNIQAAGIIPGGAIFSGREMASRPNLDQAHDAQGTTAAQRNDDKPAAGNSADTASASSSSGGNQGVISGSGAAGSQSAAPAVAKTVNNSANGSADSSANASASSASTAGTQGPAGNQSSTTDSGNGSSTHNSNSAAGNNSSAGTQLPNAAAAKASDGGLASSMPPGAGIPHENPADSVAGVHASSSVFPVSNHANATGAFAASNTNLAGTRGTPSDAFMALDSGAAGERGVLLHASPHQFAVGVTDPTLGWVEVRAERTAGQVTAALATSSAASHAALTSVLPSMASYLQEHHAGVQQVHVETGLAGGQTGTGSHSQSSPQSDGRNGAENTTVVNAASNRWTVMPLGGESIGAVRGTSSSIEGRRFSIHA
ncbi:MAG: hypothetical protein ACLQMO_12975 [Acidobacteriaceae bacterium]